ncbi:MAG: type II secretion system F family protein [Deltaproteobacteria bacterium]|nr:type II secretion system F family protein [Deltaproteobacteria bacterium]
MAAFIWTAKTKTGELRNGEMEAASADIVEQRLRAQQLTPQKVKKKPAEIHLKLPGSSGVTTRDLMLFTRQFSTMIDAGLPLVQCLDILHQQNENIWFKKVLGAVKADVEQGKTFADALSRHPKIFDPLFVNLVAAGETGGILDTIMTRLAMQTEKSVKLAKQIKGALFYPTAVMVVAVGAVAVLLLFVIPVFEKMFADFGGALPVPTQMVIDLSRWSVDHWYMFIIVPVGLVVGGSSLRRNPRGRRLLDQVFLGLPIFGPLIRKSAVARFTRTMGTMLSSGVPILDALDIVARASGNVVVGEGISFARKRVAEGKTLSEPLQETRIFPAMVCQMVSIGESAGALDTMLNKIADFYEEEVDAAVAGLTSLLEPIIMVFLAVVLGGFLIAMYLPIFTIAGNIQ